MKSMNTRTSRWRASPTTTTARIQAAIISGDRRDFPIFSSWSGSESMTSLIATAAVAASWRYRYRLFPMGHLKLYRHSPTGAISCRDAISIYHEYPELKAANLANFSMPQEEGSSISSIRMVGNTQHLMSMNGHMYYQATMTFMRPWSASMPSIDLKLWTFNVQLLEWQWIEKAFRISWFDGVERDCARSPLQIKLFCPQIRVKLRRDTSFQSSITSLMLWETHWDLFTFQYFVVFAENQHLIAIAANSLENLRIC